MIKIEILIKDTDEDVVLEVHSEGLEEADLPVQAFALAILRAIKRETRAINEFGTQLEEMMRKSHLN